MAQKRLNLISHQYNTRNATKKTLIKSASLKAQEDKMKSIENNVDVYDFTYDPNEEPPPQKKKRKKAVKKKPDRPKTVVIKGNYNLNLSKIIDKLKNAVNSKSCTKNDVSPKISEEKQPSQLLSCDNNNETKISTNQLASTTIQSEVADTNNVSVPIAEIAADIEPLDDYHHNIDYSPVNSPCRPKSPILPSHHSSMQKNRSTFASTPRSRDPLNLQAELSFFDDQPVANSSMIGSARDPLASPWRVEFQSLPIKWQANTYVKPNMTPALESSFINNFDEKKKKHVYTNLVPETNNSLPYNVENETPKLIQTSIISFIKEVAEKKSKKKRSRSELPTQVGVYGMADTATDTPTTPKKLNTSRKNDDNVSRILTNNNSGENVVPSPQINKNYSNDKENSKMTKDKKNEDQSDAKNKNNKEDNINTCFGFDDSENMDMENVFPSKKIDQGVRVLRPRTRGVLQEINNQEGPTRMLPAKAKLSPNSETVEKISMEMKSPADAPVIPDNKGLEETVETSVAEPAVYQGTDNDDSQSVHLFKDIELVHHLKPARKSYGKPKKVTFQRGSTTDSDTQSSVVSRELLYSSDEDDHGHDLHLDLDFSFKIPEVKKPRKTMKKKPKKQLMSKKEKKEADAWAAGFNSMCEDVEKFPLVVE